MSGKTRNRSSLATLLGQQPVVAGGVQDSGPQDYPEIIEEVRATAEKRDPQYGAVARATEFADIGKLTPDQTKRIIAATRKRLPHQTAKLSDEDVMSSLQDEIDPVAMVPGTGIVVYDSREMSRYSFSAREVFFAHELGHRVREAQGRPGHSEKEADKIAAEIFGPQKAVDALAELAEVRPLSNDIAFQKEKGGNKYKTDYQRALDIQKEFPEEKIDFSNFPKPTNLYGHQKTKSKKTGPVVAPGAQSSPPPSGP